MISTLLLLIVLGLWWLLTLVDQVSQARWLKDHPREPMSEAEWQDRQRDRQWQREIF